MSAEMPLVKEVTTTLREWGSIWKQLFVVWIKQWTVCLCVCAHVCLNLTSFIYVSRPIKMPVSNRSRGWCGSWWSGVLSSCLAPCLVMNSRSSSRKLLPRSTMATSMSALTNQIFVSQNCVTDHVAFIFMNCSDLLLCILLHTPFCVPLLLFPHPRSPLHQSSLYYFQHQDPRIGPGCSRWWREHLGPGAS